MPETFNVTKNVNVDGANYPVNSVVSAGQEYSNDVAVTGPDAGALTTRTDDDTGVVTLSGGHGVATGRGDLYWSGGKRIGMTFTVTVNSVAIDGGTGDVLPAQASTVYLKNPQVLSPTVDGTAMVGLLVYSGVGSNSSYLPGNVSFCQANSALIANYALTFAAPNVEWDGLAAASPLAATIGKIYFSHGNAGVTLTMGTAILYN